MPILLVVGIITLLGGFFRLYPALTNDFPIGDGGLFYIMARELQAAHLALPQATAYNGGEIAFIYPPLGHYLLVIFTFIFRTSLLTTMRFMPAIFSILTIPAFYFLAERLLKQKNAAVLATASFALLSPTYDWMIMGGGITRAPGFFFALLAMTQIAALYETASRRALVLAGVYCGLTVLSHPAMAWFVFYSSLLFFFLSRPTWKKLGQSLIVAAMTLVLSSPWWAVAIARYGLTPFANGLSMGTASFSGWSLLLPALFMFTNEPLLDLQAVLGLLGLLCALRDRLWLPVAWFGIVFFAQTKESAIVATIPFALLVGWGVSRLVLPGLGAVEIHGAPESRSRPNLAQGLFLLYALIVGLCTAFLASASLTSISGGDIAAMRWIQANTSAEARFIVLAGEKSADIDTIEWFPALTERVSVNTNEGTEWSETVEGVSDLDTITRVQACTLESMACITDWAAQTGSEWNYLYLSAPAALLEDGTPTRLVRELNDSASFSKVFENSAALVYRRVNENN